MKCKHVLEEVQALHIQLVEKASVHVLPRKRKSKHIAPAITFLIDCKELASGDYFFLHHP